MAEFHLGHVPGTVLVDKAELDELRQLVGERDARIKVLERALNAIVDQDSAWGEYVGLVLSGRLEQILDAAVPNKPTPPDP